MPYPFPFQFMNYFLLCDFYFVFLYLNFLFNISSCSLLMFFFIARLRPVMHVIENRVVCVSQWDIRLTHGIDLIVPGQNKPGEFKSRGVLQYTYFFTRLFFTT